MAGNWRLEGWEGGGKGIIQYYSIANVGLDRAFITRKTIEFIV